MTEYCVNQQQQLLQEKKQKTTTAFDRVCPVWSKRLEGEYNSHYAWNLLTDSSKCVVGEAYGWTRHYEEDGDISCKECSSFGSSICGSYTMGDQDIAKSTAEDFAQHFEEVHAK